MRHALALALCACALAAAAPIPMAAAGCDASAVPANTVYLPNITKTLGGPDGWVTPFIVQNTGSAAATFDVSFYRFSDGSLVTCRHVGPFAPGASYADVPNADSDLPEDAQFSVVVRSFGATAVAVVNQQQGNGDRFQTAAYDGVSSGATTVYIPNVTRRFFGYDVPFIVQNVGTAAATGRATFTSFDGAQHLDVGLSIAPGRSQVVDPNFTPGLIDGTQYSVVVTSDQPVSAVVNAHNETGAPVAYSYNGIIATDRPHVVAPYLTKGQPAPGGSSPVIVQNVDTFAAMVQVTLTRYGDPSAQQIHGPSLAPGASWVFDPRFRVGTTEPCDEVAPDCIPSGLYTVEVLGFTQTAPERVAKLAAIVIPTSDTTAMAYAAAPLPILGSTNGPRSWYLPNVTKELGGPGGWTTPIALANAGTQTATLYFYRFSDGQLATSVTVAFPGTNAYSGLLVDPRDLPDLPGGQYAVVVNGNYGPLIATVLETTGGSGDGAMAYEGFPSDQLFAPR